MKSFAVSFVVAMMAIIIAFVGAIADNDPLIFLSSSAAVFATVTAIVIGVRITKGKVVPKQAAHDGAKR